jgi:acetyl-CoA carboxylase carboxyl transferase subunit beta
MRVLADLVARWRTPEPRFPAEQLEDQACVLCGTPARDTPGFESHGVCGSCGYHHAISAWARIRLLADPGTFRESHASTTSVDPLSFPDGGTYRRQLREAFRRTALREAAITGTCEVRGRSVMLIVLDFGFLGGSMGVVVGERVAQAFEDATRRKMPVVSVISSSGVRVREGVLALTQMAKTAAAAERHHRAGLPHIGVLSNPSTGAAFGSFANLADVLIGEPGALMGFTSLRDLQGDGAEPLDAEAHTSEAHLAHGLIDQVVARDRQRDLLITLIDLVSPPTRIEITRRLEPFVRPGDRGISPWHAVELARHSQRPNALDYIARMTTSFVELRGDRSGEDDPGIVAGLADLGGEAAVLIGQQGEPGGQAAAVRPAGLRKAMRAVRLAQKFTLPVVTLVDTRGVAQTRAAEEAGLGAALAATLALMSRVRTPVLAVIIGEGGSSAALALSVADRVLILEHAIFTIASPEEAALALHGDASRVDEVAEGLRLTARDARDLGVVDLIVREPQGGAHADPDAAASLLRTAIVQELGALATQRPGRLARRRYHRYRRTPVYQNFFRVSLGRNLGDLRRLALARVQRWIPERLRLGAPEPDEPGIPVD